MRLELRVQTPTAVQYGFQQIQPLCLSCLAPHCFLNRLQLLDEENTIPLASAKVFYI